MNDDLNPYAAPKASAVAAPVDFGIPDGDLDAALAGLKPLNIGEVFSDAWRLVHGMKKGTAVATMVVGLVLLPLIVLIVAAMLAYAGIGTDILMNPAETEARMEGLSQDPLYLLLAGLMAIPMNALSYMSVTNIGLRRAGGHVIRVRDAFPMSGVLKAAQIFLVLWPLGLLGSLHPLAAYLTTPLYLLMFWVPAVLLDRDDQSIFQAVKISAKLTRHTWVFLLVNAAIVVLGYMATVCTLGIAFFWFLPWVCSVYGVAWRRLAGLQSPRLREP